PLEHRERAPPLARAELVGHSRELSLEHVRASAELLELGGLLPQARDLSLEEVLAIVQRFDVVPVGRGHGPSDVEARRKIYRVSASRVGACRMGAGSWRAPARVSA